MLAKDTDLFQLNDDFLSRNGGSAPHVQAAVRTRRALNPEHAEQDQKDLLATLEIDSASLNDAVVGLKMLKDWETKPNVISEYIGEAQKRWPEATAFRTKEQSHL